MPTLKSKDSNAKDAPSADSEQVLLLGRLASAERTTNTSINKAAEVLKSCPDWEKCEANGIIPPNSSQALCTLHKAKLLEQGTMMAENEVLVQTLLHILRVKDYSHALQYVLTLIYEVVRNDTNKYDDIATALKKQKVFETLFNLTNEKDSYVADKAAYLLSGLMCRSLAGSFTKEEVKALVEKVLTQRTSLTETGRLDALCNLLKLSDFRTLIWEMSGFLEFVLEYLKPTKPAPCVYRAAFITWLFSMNQKSVRDLVDEGLLKAICVLLSENRTEKVVRVCIHTLRNALCDDDAVELIIEENSVQVLTLLEYDKWRDQEMYDEIREGLHFLHQKINQFSNFSRYKLELDKEKMKWSFLHSEKFWHENVMQFEDNEFEAVKKLIHLLKSKDEITVCVACHDLGEFARLHPAGKQICHKLQVKQKIMVLMQSSQREIGREALLACQKLMLQRWQEVQKPSAAA
eukprot:Selendium_serpulae@DN5411_c0_g1_i1.p1